MLVLLFRRAKYVCPPPLTPSHSTICRLLDSLYVSLATHCIPVRMDSRLPHRSSLHHENPFNC